MRASLGQLARSRGRFATVGVAVFLWLRGIAFSGRKHQCPICGWHVRSFVKRGASFRRRPNGYCPRCASKARHRRDWLFLREHTDLGHHRQLVFHVAPRDAIAAALASLPGVTTIGGDIQPTRSSDIVLDISRLPIPDSVFDVVICIHVLEHVEDDRAAFQELYRVMKPGSWALITVPIRLDQPTVEDPNVTDPEERERLFGERSHYRWYGRDFVDRLEAVGFEPQWFDGADIDAEIAKTYGLLPDEHIYLCRHQGH